jgi:hypothetical protein
VFRVEFPRLDLRSYFDDDLRMGFNRRKMEAERKAKADAEVAAVFADAERLIAAWNERQARRMPLLFAPTIGAALAARYRRTGFPIQRPRK